MNADATLTADRNPQLTASWADTLTRVRAFVASRVDDPEVAADITQDVIVRSIASGALARVDNPAAWLYRSARNAVIDHYRTRRAHAPVDELAAWPEPEVDDRPNDATRELSRCLQPLLDQLAPAAREALVRVDVDGQTQHRAARESGLSLTGMKSQISPTPSGARKRVISTFVSGQYSCLCVLTGQRGSMLKRPPFSSSRIAAKILGESKAG